MDLRLTALSHLGDTSVFTAGEARSKALAPSDIERLCRDGSLVRLAVGTYLDGERWAAASRPHRHALTTSAHALLLGPTLGGAVALSHVSAAAWWDLPLLSVPQRGHLIRRDEGAGHTRRAFTVHQRFGPDQCSEGVAVPSGDTTAKTTRQPIITTQVVSPCLAALGVAHVRGVVDRVVDRVVALDAALHHRQSDPDEVMRWLTRLKGRDGITAMRRCAAAADGRSKSPLDSQARLVLQALGYHPMVQVRLTTRDGAFVARVDLLLDALGVVVEVEGRVTYTSATGTETLVSEKRRESAIVDLGYAVLRLERHDLDDLRGLDARLRATARRAHP